MSTLIYINYKYKEDYFEKFYLRNIFNKTEIVKNDVIFFDKQMKI